MEIKVLGRECANCKRLYAEAEKAIVEAGLPATLTKVEAMEEIVAFGILRTPGLVIDLGPGPGRRGDHDHDHHRRVKGVVASRAP